MSVSSHNSQLEITNIGNFIKSQKFWAGIKCKMRKCEFGKV